jgi:hypothetical protein
MIEKGTIVGLAVAAAAFVGASCTSGGPSSSAEATGRQGPAEIPQPVLLGDLPVAPEGERVDVTMPTFSDPTNVTNPLFPVSRQRSVLLLGKVDGEPFRTEVTLLPETRIIEWQGHPVEVLVSQYAAFLGGRIHEVAYDFYAQADDGSVWYFGEDVFNFKDGAISDTHGTWIAGKDGPAAMIMPADPKVGDVYRPENIPGFVFEEVTVQSVDQPLDGPLGSLGGGLIVQEMHMDGQFEDKTFAPGYGEFYTAGGGDVEALAMAVPTDQSPEPAPAELVTLSDGALEVFEAAGSARWSRASSTVEAMTAAWDTVQTGEVPRMIEPRMTQDLRALAAAVKAESVQRARQAAIDVDQWALDLQLRHRPAAEVDLARFDLWLAQLIIDAAAGDAASVNGDYFTLDYIRDRILHTLEGADATRVNEALEGLQGAVGDEDLAAAAESAERLRQTLAGLR